MKGKEQWREAIFNLGTINWSTLIDMLRNCYRILLHFIFINFKAIQNQNFYRENYPKNTHVLDLCCVAM